MPMPSIWLFILYFFIKSSIQKKIILFFSIFFLLIPSLPVVSHFLSKIFYSNNYKISKNNKKPSYILIPTAGIWHDGFGKWHPTYTSIRRVKYGQKLADQFSIPMILAGGGNKKINESDLISNYFNYNFFLVENKSKNTFEMAKNLKNIIDSSNGPILLVTSPLHNKRVILSLESQNFEVLIPDNYLKIKKKNYSIIPSFNALKGFNEIIYEGFGIIWYHIRFY